MEKNTKKRSRAVPTSTLTTPTTPTVGNALHDLVFQYSDPLAAPSSLELLHQQQQQQQQQHLSQQCPPDGNEDGGEGGEAVAAAGMQGQQSIQTSLDQLGSDISLIKSQIVKKKSKMTLVDLNDKLDLIVQFLAKNGK